MGACNVPVLPVGVTYVEIAAGYSYTVARRSDGVVAAWGSSCCNYSPSNAPALPAGLTYVEIAAGDHHAVARYDVAAAVVSVGAGCGGAGMPVFGCNPPRIGQSVLLTLTSGTPNAAGFLYESGVPVAPYPLGSGCEVQLELASAFPAFPLMTDGTGAWSQGFVIPPDPNLAGIQAAFQAALFSTSGPLGFDLSNGLIATVGY